MIDRLTILTGDAALRLPEIASEYVQMVVTSPPYDDLRTCYKSDFDFETIATEIYRVLCEGGVLCWNVGDSTIAERETHITPGLAL